MKTRGFSSKTGRKTTDRMGTRKNTRVGEAGSHLVYLPEDIGPVGRWKKRIGKTDDDSCGKCGVQVTVWHLVFECPVN